MKMLCTVKSRKLFLSPPQSQIVVTKCKLHDAKPQYPVIESFNQAAVVTPVFFVGYSDVL